MVNIFFIILVSQMASLLTHELSLKESFGPVRASSFLTIVFVLFTSFFHFKGMASYHAVFLGSTFVGMSDPKRLSRLEISLASFGFVLFFIFLSTHLKGLGGALGFTAFSSCLVVYLLSKVALKSSKRISNDVI